MPIWAKLVLCHLAGLLIGGVISFVPLRLKIQNLAFELMRAKADLAAEKSRRP